MKLIVNADDYGRDENATRAIAACFDAGIISQTTAMVNMPWFEQGLKIAQEKGFLNRIGLHLNLSEGTPLTDEIKASRFFCDEEGNFKGGLWKGKVNRFWMRPGDVKVALVEVEAQFSRFVAMGLPMRHYDSHQYVSSYLPLCKSIGLLARQYGFLSTRGFVDADIHCGQERSVVKRLFVELVNRAIAHAGLKRADAVGFAWDVGRLVKTGLQVVEIHCHPNFRDGDGNLAMGGNLMDWKTPYEESLSLLADKAREVRFSVFGEGFA